MPETTTLPRRHLAFLTAAGALAAAAPALAQATKAAPKPAAESIEALKSLLEEHNKAFSSHDLQGVLRAFAPNALMIGTGPGEIWGTHAEIGDAYKHFFLDFDKDQQSFEPLFRDGGIRGDTAWLMTLTKVTMKKGKETREFGINISAVFEKGTGGWLIRAMHFSNLTGGPAPKDASKKS